MMEKLKHKAESLAEAKVQKTRVDIKTVLAEELPDAVSVEETSDGIMVSSRGLGRKVIDNSSLRDVAFLMRGVR